MAGESTGNKRKSPVGDFFRALGTDCREIGTTLKEGDWKTRLSCLIFGFGPIARGRVLLGAMYLAAEAVLLWFIFGFGMYRVAGDLSAVHLRLRDAVSLQAGHPRAGGDAQGQSQDGVWR